MKLVLITGEDCPVCEEAEAQFRQQYKHEIERGEATIVDIDLDEDMQRLWLKEDHPIPPTIVIVTEENRLISTVEATEFLADHEHDTPKATPGAAEPVEQAVESSGSEI